MKLVRQYCVFHLLLVLAASPFLEAFGQDSEPKSPHARWERSIQRMEDKDKESSRPRGGVLFVGSSSIRMWKLPSSFPDLAAINHGFGGSQIDDTIHFADRIVWPFEPKVIVFYAGDNDIAAGKTPEVVAADFATFSKLVQDNLPETTLIYVAIKPSIARWNLAEPMIEANAAIAQQCAEDDKRIFLDVWQPMLGDDGKPMSDLFLKDGLHMNSKGYAMWNEQVQAELNKLQEPVAAE